VTTVLLFGDSNTHGTKPMAGLEGSGRFGREARWAGHLARALGPAVELIEEGHPGRTTVHDDPIEGAHRNGLRVLPALLESHEPLDLVVIMLGSNDFKARFSVTATDVALSVERLAKLVRASQAGPEGRAPGLLLVAPPPVQEAGCLAGMFAGGAAKSPGLAAELARVAERQGAAFLDAAAHVAVSPLDGVHFEPEGHAALGAAMAEAIRPLIGS
jgi:lysophospholipase L1-like esterase